MDFDTAATLLRSCLTFTCHRGNWVFSCWLYDGVTMFDLLNILAAIVAKYGAR